MAEVIEQDTDENTEIINLADELNINLPMEMDPELRDMFKDDDLVTFATDELNADLSDAVSTGIPPLDVYIGGGIFPGRMYEIFGEESHGKSTLAYLLATVWQAMDPMNVVHIIETESAVDKIRCAHIGMDLSRLLVTETDILEEGFDKIAQVRDKLAAKGRKVMHIWDTISAASSKNEMQGDQYAGGMQEKPRLIKSFFRKNTKAFGATNNVLLLIQQVIDGGGYGGGVATTGGHSIKHHMSVRIFVKRSGVIFDASGNKAIGSTVTVKLVKIKVAPTMGKAFDLDMYFESGFDAAGSTSKHAVATIAHTNKDLKEGLWKSGSHYYLYHLFQDEIDEKKRAPLHFHGEGQMTVAVKKSTYMLKLLEYYLYDAFVKDFPLAAIKYKDHIQHLKDNLYEEWKKVRAEYGYTEPSA